jgi:hypothetical protein
MNAAAWWSVLGFAATFSLTFVIVPILLRLLIEIRSKPPRHHRR